MTIRLTIKQLRDRKIYNEWYLAALQDSPKVYLEYHPATDGYLGQYARWSFRQYTGGEITSAILNRPSEQKQYRRLALLEWATKEYGISEWERSPFGSYHPVGTLAKAAAIEVTP